VEEKSKQNLCMLCAKPSEKSICDACANKVQGEIGNKRKKERERTE